MRQRLPDPLFSSILPFMAFLLFCQGLGLGCAGKNYSILHRPVPLSGIVRESAIFDQGELRIHWVAYYPERPGRLPAVLVHPDAQGVAEDMEGVCFGLARAGYFAAAVDYERVGELKRGSPFTCCKDFEEATASLIHLLSNPRVDQERVGLLGFSKGGTHSLLVAAGKSGIKAVVAYYPLSDFEEWLDPQGYSFFTQFRIRRLRREVMRREGTTRWEDVLPEVQAASPIHYVDSIRAPVLLIHGERDRTVSLGQSRRFCEALRAAGGSCELLVVPGAGHVFNFRNREKAELAWERTLEFLRFHLK
jgi:dienelactone hydrolase